jgi:signal transduction histidine kinase
MQLSALRRTTTFRLTTLYGLIFALGAVALLAMVYLQSAVYLTHRVDGILTAEADALMQTPGPRLPGRVLEDLALSGGRTTVIALFSPAGARVVGNLAALPPGLRVDGPPLEIPPTAIFQASARLIARRLPSGEVLVVGRDISQLQQMRAIIGQALLWSGAIIIIVGLACGLALSIRPLRRLRELQQAAEEIGRGDLKRRMPLSANHDELDMLAATVNHMMGEVERLMSEVKGATETIAHELITPLTRASTRLHRMQQTGGEPTDFDRLAADVDEVLDRFRAILRISELEARQRRAGFRRMDLADIVGPVADLYQPLAEAGGIRLSARSERGAEVEADPKLMVEAVSNLVDNAIKFSRPGGRVQVRLGEDPAEPRIIVEDDGPGIPGGEREAVLQRFYRGERDRLAPGAGLGLSIVAAIVRLHGFELRLEDAQPGLRAVIDCRRRGIAY